MQKGRFKFEHLNNYPHMSREDTLLWDQFIDLYPKFFESVDFDIPVGDFRGKNIDLPKEWARNREYLGKMKIDVIGYKSDEIFIIEVKPKAWAKALGQIVMYDSLYTAEFRPKVKTHATIITDEIMPNMPELCDEHDITLLIV